LDEVATNIDKRGLLGIFKMICELAREKQVFVVTHDQNLADMLDNADLITVRKENGFSVKI
jgi:ABC-type lipoprotein export system ATPase subunit